MGTRRRARAAERLAQALTHGEGPTDLRTLIVHGPIANPSFEQAPTLRVARIDEAIALEADEPEPEPEMLPEAPANLPFPSPAPTRGDTQVVAIELAPPPATRRRLAVVAAAAALLLAGLTAAAVLPGMPSTATGSTLGAGLASLTRRAGDSDLVDAAPPLPDRMRLAPAPAEPRLDDDEPILVLDEGQRRRKAAPSRRRASRRAARPRAAGLLDQATSALQAGARDHAIDLYERAITANPRSSAAAAGLSIAYFDLGRFDLATAWAERAVKADFANADYHVLLGDAYYRNASLDDARVQWRTAAKLGSSRAHDRLAKLEE